MKIIIIVQSTLIVVAMLTVSFVGWHLPVIGSAASLVLSIGIFALYFRTPHLAVAAVLAELAFGGKGWLLSFGALGEPIPIRILLFIALMSAWAIKFIVSQYRIRELVSVIPHSMRMSLGALFIFIAWGIVWGLLRNNGVSNVLLDANAYGYWLLLLPLFTIGWYNHAGNRLDTLFQILAGAGVSLCLLTLVLYNIFDHQYTIAETLYQWIRDTWLGEITYIRPGAWRIFLQSQIWLLVVWAWAATLGVAQFFRRRELGSLNALPPAKIDNPSLWERICIGSILILSSSALIISFSRSYWVGWGAAVFVFISFSVFVWKKWKRAMAVVAISVVGGFVLATAVQRIPPLSAGFPLKERMALEEAGTSRIAQLRPLLNAIARHPIIGSGFGAQVTYHSADPRVVAGTAGGSGEYTTYAFEWGYLDIWLKIGLIGLISCISLIGGILIRLWQVMKGHEMKERLSALTLFTALIGLAVVNIFSPYLNHPLGIGIVLLSIISVKNDNEAHITYV